MRVAKIQTAHFAAVLAANKEFEVETAPLTQDDLTYFIAQSFHASQCCDGQAFLISFAEHSQIEGENFTWFQNNYPAAVYIDRVVVAANLQGKGCGKQLYEDLFATAKAAGRAHIGCEVNLEPPNPGSHIFHVKMGFETVGEARLSNGKLVRYYLKNL